MFLVVGRDFVFVRFPCPGLRFALRRKLGRDKIWREREGECTVNRCTPSKAVAPEGRLFALVRGREKYKINGCDDLAKYLPSLPSRDVKL